ncbi:MAG: tRNA (N(6)-L-threonylcarbamoyladenosine(37)-C(2))-methylthiotransferase MtaB [Clostridiales bacterium]|nr:tRNA (N(6)-L-threonylcarbamoyladenosine(37)-C(2))-methylthiotransferase MtaB [Clostridiales bacterium]
MRIAFYTLGCKVNQYETEAMRELLEREGYTPVGLDDDPEVFLLNSCTVTAESSRKTRQLLRKYRRLFPHAVTVLTGCMPQAFPDEAAALPEADIVLGNRDAALAADALRRFRLDGQRIVEVSPHEKGEVFSTPPVNRFSEHTRAFMKIEDGCDRFCSYCIIPTARGRVRSREVGDIRSEAVRLAAAGYKEIVLVGINLSAYGKGGCFDLADAAEAVCGVEGIERVRLGSLEPDQMRDETLDRLAAQPKFCPQFHLSLQSGCDRTLARMNRRYDAAFYRDLIQRIRSRFVNAAFTTDVMVGFPGETEDDFEESAAFVREIGFAKAHVFAYSRRSGTAADRMPEQLSRQVKEDRSRRMIQAAEEVRRTFLQSQVGLTCPVLFETCTDGILEGCTPNYTFVHVPGSPALCGGIYSVRIAGLDDGGCTGVLAKG